MSDGILYMAYGQKAIEQAERNVQALGNDWPVAVVSDGAVKGAVNIRFEGDFYDTPVEGQHKGRQIFLPGRVKPRLYELSPFERTLYLDADTRVVQSPQPLFNLLDVWEFAAAVGQGWGGLLRDTRFSSDDLARTRELWGTDLLHYINSGVLGWRKCPNCEALFRQWDVEYNEHGGWDEQLSLLRALYRVPVLFTMLPTAWNSRLEGGAYIYHPTGREEVWSATVVPLCTVVIPCYDHEAFLSEAVESALQPNTVVIVVDDGSPGDIVEAIRHFEGYPVYLIRQENRGLAAARNAGIRAARSKVVLDLDADDRLAASAVKDMYEVYRPGSFVFGDVRLFGDVNLVMHCEVTEQSLRTMQPCHPSIMYSKEEWARAGGYDESLRYYTSWDFMVRMWEFGIQARRCPKVCVEYRKRKGQGMLAAIARDREGHMQALWQRHPEFFGRRVR